MFINCLQDTGQYQQELHIFMRCFPRIQKVNAIICGNGPVIMFSGAVHTGKGLFMKQAMKAMLTSCLFQDLHYQLVLIHGHVCFCINGCQLMLCRSHFVMLCFCCNTKLPQLFVHILHKCCDSLTDGAEVMIIHFLTLGRHSSKKGTSCKDQVFSLQVFLFIYQEVFLLRSNGRSYLFRCSISKQTDQS